MADPIADLIGDYRGFAARQRDRLAALAIDIEPFALSHLAVRVADWDGYVLLRTLLERHATANLENVWNGRPISKGFGFTGFRHVDDWVPQRFVTATGPNPLPR